MEKNIKDSMSQIVLEEARNFYDFAVKDLKDLRGFENFVYGFDDYVIRFVHSSHRSFNLVLAEIEFIDYLSNNGAAVSTVIFSKLGNISERINIDESNYFTVSLFTKAPGSFVKKEEMSNELFGILGEDIARLHRLTKSFKPVHFRNEWDQENYIEIYGKYILPEDNVIFEKYSEIVHKLNNIKRSNSNFGLIHTDLHFGNMYISNNNLTFFDFDDSSYHYFVSDIAIVLYYYFVFTNKEDDRVEKTKIILPEIIKGYRKIHPISKVALLQLNDFLKLREIVIYLVLMGDEHLRETNSNMNKFVESLRFNIVNDIPFYDDLEELVNTL